MGEGIRLAEMSVEEAEGAVGYAMMALSNKERGVAGTMVNDLVTMAGQELEHSEKLMTHAQRMVSETGDATSKGIVEYLKEKRMDTCLKAKAGIAKVKGG